MFSVINIGVRIAARALTLNCADRRSSNTAAWRHLRAGVVYERHETAANPSLYRLKLVQQSRHTSCTTRSVLMDPSQLEPVRRSVLFTSVHDLHRPPSFLATAISTATRKTTENLRIILFSPLFAPVPSSAQTRPCERDASPEKAAGISHTERWDDVQRLLTYVYVQATKIAQEMGRVLMDIDVLLKGPEDHVLDGLIQDTQRIYCVSLPDRRLPPLPASLAQRAAEIVSLPPDDTPQTQPHAPPPASDPSLPPLVPVAALGGTFDHLHAGHKILLSMGAWIAGDKLIVGITDDALLKNKANRDVLEKLPVRIARTRAFLELFKPALCYDLVPISDVYGPTAWDPNVQALVVSKETLPGASSSECRMRHDS
ncbi:hypothetical protein AcW2_004972 [Taiwanofungus camphoratus]|nr:hypothetical protein AcW2_004972 [Antrodia cinnamomea]